jgi:uncharacterized protein
MDWTLSSLALVSLTFLAAGLVKGVTGMGLPTVAMAVLATAVAPAVAAAILVIPSLATNAWQALSGPATGYLLRRLWAMMIGIVVGTVAASAMLVRVDPIWSAFALGLALVAYAGCALVLPAMTVPPHLETWLSPGVGVATGAVTGITGVFVMPVVPYLQALSMGKDELVQALGLAFTVSTVALAAGLVMHDAFRPDQLGLSILATVPAFAGMWLGQRIRARASPVRFRQCFLMLLGLLGLELCSRPFL